MFTLSALCAKHIINQNKLRITCKTQLEGPLVHWKSCPMAYKVVVVISDMLSLKSVAMNLEAGEETSLAPSCAPSTLTLCSEPTHTPSHPHHPPSRVRYTGAQGNFWESQTVPKRRDRGCLVSQPVHGRRLLPGGPRKAPAPTCAFCTEGRSTHRAPSASTAPILRCSLMGHPWPPAVRPPFPICHSSRHLCLSVGGRCHW